jgi:toxin ParE1/3/4
MAEFIVSPEAASDLEAIHNFIELDNADAADRVLEKIHLTVLKIARSPGIGSRVRVGRCAVEGLRSLPVAGFRKYRVIYRKRESRIEVIRVLHSSRDAEHLLDAR